MTTRRRMLIGAISTASGLAIATLIPGSARATPATMLAAMKRVMGDAPLRKGKVTLDIPPLVENGNTVAIEVTVDSPMTGEDYVKAIHVFNEKNPQSNVISVHIGPRAGRAAVATRMRLADSQKVTAVAELSDGTFWSDDADVIVTLAACLETP
jgi:sulfur-oxidizing protein SoxY